MRLVYLLLFPALLFGKTETTTLEDGCTLTRIYTNDDHLESITASDDSLHHTFHYNESGELILAVDHLQNITIRRHLKENGKLRREIFNHLFLIEKSYDEEERLKSLSIHDKGRILFKYKDGRLKKAMRLAPSGKKLYVHNFDTYDSEGKLLQETMIFDLGKIAYEWTENKKISAIKSPFFNQKCMYNRRGELINTVVDGHATHYVYSTEDNLFVETSRQHLILYPDDHETVEKIPTYDRLGRLVATVSDTTKTTFTYDPLGRLLAKKVQYYEAREPVKTLEEYYLYDDNTHIATLDRDGTLKALRILTPGDPAERALAVELEGKVFAPISDTLGHIRALIDHKTKRIATTHDYSYFGKELFFDNPKELPFLPKASY